MYGTFCSWATRILFCIRLSESSTSTRRPRDRSSVGELLRRLNVAVGDGHDDGLDRRDPQRKRAGEVLDEDADEPLERAVDRAVDCHRPLLLAVLVDVRQRSNRSGSITRSTWIVAICHSRPSASSM